MIFVPFSNIFISLSDSIKHIGTIPFLANSLAIFAVTRLIPSNLFRYKDLISSDANVYVGVCITG